MSRVKKICLASALVIVGFGVAKFLGQPIPFVPAFNSPRAASQLASNEAPLPIVPSGGSHTAASVRLVPDVSTTYSSIPATNTAPALPEPPALGSSLAPLLSPIEADDLSKMPQSVQYTPIASAPTGESGSSRAKLRNEAPRPIGIDPQSPVAIRRTPPTSAGDADSYTQVETQTGRVNWPIPQLVNSELPDASKQLPAAIAASYDAPAASLQGAQVSPTPWPVAEENAEPITHTIVDGDSLEKLANRYLADSRRSREIYELNRNVLSAPDLLPIGAELKIPERVASSAWSTRGFQPNSASSATNRNASASNLQPAEAASSSQSIIPRAQLAAPVMVE